MWRIPNQWPLLSPEGKLHGKPRLCEATILPDPDRRRETLYLSCSAPRSGHSSTHWACLFCAKSSDSLAL